MTMIAAYEFLGHPLVCGDLLISREGNNQTQVGVPTVGDVTDFFGSGWSISGLQQKVVIISPNCVIAWAGSFLGGRIAVSALRESATTERLTAEAVLDVLARQQDLQTHAVSIVGWCEEDGRFRKFWFNAETVSVPGVGEVCLAGSAVDWFAGCLSDAVGMLRYENGEPSNPLDHWYALVTAMVSGEVFQGDGAESLRNLFGGGYELAYYGAAGFEKLGDYTMVLWTAEVGATQLSLNMPRFVQRQTYVGDTLLISAARFGNSSSAETLHIERQTHHLIGPMYAPHTRVTAADVGYPTFESRTILHAYLARVAGRINFGMRLESVPTLDDARIRFTQGEHGWLTGVQIAKAVFDQVANDMGRFAPDP